MGIRTDIAYELFKNLTTHTNDISLETEEFLYGVTSSKVVIKNENGSKTMGKSIGTYITVESNDVLSRDLGIQKYTAKIVSNKLKGLIEKNLNKKEYTSLVVGLGNKNMTADALGNYVCDKIIVTRHIFHIIQSELDKNLQCVSSIAPSVLGQTGVETYDIIKGVVEKIKPDIVIVVDSLASQKTSRISTTFQISDGGIVPGGGLNNPSMSLDRASLGVPVISLGVPLVVFAETICREVIEKMDNRSRVSFDEGTNASDIIKSTVNEVLGELVVTPKDIDVIVKDSAFILSIAINLALHPRLNMDDVISYTH